MQLQADILGVALERLETIEDYFFRDGLSDRTGRRLLEGSIIDY
jgi:hypothetical protein